MKMNIDDIRKEAEQQGFRVERTNKSHWKFIPPDPDKPIVIGSSTPHNEFGARKALMRQLKHSGFRQAA
jgi:predicted RNA binding protein YcfA (HicA-like mRNA interferase family)